MGQVLISTFGSEMKFLDYDKTITLTSKTNQTMTQDGIVFLQGTTNNASHDLYINDNFMDRLGEPWYKSGSIFPVRAGDRIKQSGDYVGAIFIPFV